ncbi:ArnT family glycosyltransferase [Sphingomicrobium astaxanthinifaciens]|uniref:ArnT family glycosyltransferase n=1 Tax=Sphingomicrobium astaxanthinifaciens TaxID=1227949 RepID=UPI001FCB87DA|nr:hypothetical protein [Sphingomicrobium astaxanthinifaciens]MCJ7421791.1 hypothetical protein [Sphingomicrobium astaxanthinifaciens]
MTAITATEAPRRARWGAAALIALVVLALRLPLHPIAVLSVDESAYMLVARDLLAGQWPFAGAFDHKPIALYLHYAAAMGLGGEDPSAIRWLATLAALGSALTLWWIARRVFALPPRAALLVGLGWAFASFGLEGYSSNTEILLNGWLMLWLAAFLGWSRGAARFAPAALLSGLAAGIAVQVNYLAGPLLAALYLGALLPAPRKHVGWLLASGLVAIAVALLLLVPLLLAGTLEGYVAQQVAFLSRYQGNIALADWGTVLRPVALELAPLMLVALLLGLAARGAQGAPGERAARGGLGLLGLLYLAAAVTMALVSGRVFAHYFHLLLPGLFLIVLEGLAASPAARRARLSLLLLLATLPGLFVALGQAQRGIGVARTLAAGGLPELDRERSATRLFAEHVPPGASGYVTCAQPIYYLTLGLEAPTRYPFWSIHVYGYLPGLDPETHIRAIHARAPEVFIIGENCPEAELAMIEGIFADYVEVAAHRGVRLALRPDLVPPGAPRPAR